MKRKHLGTVAGALLVLAASACSGSGSASHAVASPTASARQAYLAYARCLREHGVDEADPSFDQNGNPIWQVNPKQVPQDEVLPCQYLLQGIVNSQSRQPANPARLAAMTRFSRCMRQHGMPGWPDPSSDGSGFPTTSDPTLDPAFQPALTACNSLLPTGK
jgi:hypothetical protein